MYPGCCTRRRELDGDQKSEQAMNASGALAVGIYLCGGRGFPTDQDLSVVDQAYPSRKLAWECSFKAFQGQRKPSKRSRSGLPSFRTFTRLATSSISVSA
jgi:hypothetical protein